MENNKNMQKKIKFLSIIPILLIIILLLDYCIINKIGGDYDKNNLCSKDKLSPGAMDLIKKAYTDIIPHKLLDFHVHIVGIGESNSNLYLNPEFMSWKNLFKRIKFSVYLSAAGVTSIDKLNEQYLNRLNKLIDNCNSFGTGKYQILAFDKNYKKTGEENLKNTEFYVSNKYITELAKKNRNKFIPAISIHPYRKDALSELKKWAKAGVRVIKWLPNAMGINPSDKSIIPYYKLMKKYNMVLLSHAGHEAAVDAKDMQALGNPLLLRLPLDIGVKIVVAHCASLGKDIDLDDPEKSMVSSFNLFLRLMDNEKYKGLLFGDISAINLANRSRKVLETIIKRGGLHKRLVNGSDYPIPATNITIHTSSLANNGFITDEEKKYLNEIYKCNPLLFDFVLKRTLKAPGTDKKFSPSIFMVNERI